MKMILLLTIDKRRQVTKRLQAKIVLALPVI